MLKSAIFKGSKIKKRSLIFAVTILLIGIGCYTAAFAANGNGNFYAFIPEKGVVSKDGGTKNFIMPKNATVLIQRTLSAAASLPILTKIKGSLK